MYSLDINFLKDRIERPADQGFVQTRTERESQRPLYIGVAIAAFLPALALGLWWFLQTRNSALENRLAELDTQLATVNALQQQVTDINGQVETLNNDSKALAVVFDRIKPWSAVLQDVRDRVPSGVQISLIEQAKAPPPAAAPPPPPPASPAPGAVPAPVAAPPPPQTSLISISGRAGSFSDVNDFVLTLQQSRFLMGDSVKLTSAQLVDNPTTVQFAETSGAQVQVKLPQVVQYKIESRLTDLPATQLLQDMERTLAVGLPARIQALRDRGVLTP
jgi:type IV pilus assembly protein PilN